ncbi:DsbA family oxidoreductase [Jonesia quinghaiensis]|uniref:DsbA family oxidoreductase n=1 Tax=Jonesia quinghaiensis TaxID=262806 RepID=UPI000418F64F|nr:DsbA family oxidoreductase [Jonesia quinghaiensis]
MKQVQVDIWSDIACPWCFIGKRRFEKALAEFAPNTVNITYHSFELAPDTPTNFNGSEVDFLTQHKGISPDQASAMLDQVTQIAASEGLQYNFDTLRHTNTRLAHQALHLAKNTGHQGALKELLLTAYFEQGKHVGDIDTLVVLATEAGLDPEVTRQALTTQQYADAVDADIAQAGELGIHGVPFFVFNTKYAVSGAQDPSVFLAALTRAAQDEPQPLTPIGHSDTADTCGPDGCAI